MANCQPGHGHPSFPSSASHHLLPSQRKTFQNLVKKMKPNPLNPFVSVVDNSSRVLRAEDLNVVQQFGRVTESENNDDIVVEVINHQPYDQKADVFSFAIVLWELVIAKVSPEVHLGVKKSRALNF